MNTTPETPQDMPPPRSSFTLRAGWLWVNEERIRLDSITQYRRTDALVVIYQTARLFYVYPFHSGEQADAGAKALVAALDEYFLHAETRK